MTLAPEGRVITLAAAAVAVAGSALWGWAGAWLWLFVLFAAQFFREPSRAPAARPGEVLSAADGRVVFVGDAPSPHDGAACVKISVFMSPFDVHANRAPAAGKVARSERFAGAFFNAALDKASEKNERHLLVLECGEGNIACMQVAGFLARRVLCYAKAGDMLAAGERYGFIRFGSRADLYLPRHFSPAVALGAKVRAGLSVVARAGNNGNDGSGGETRAIN